MSTWNAMAGDMWHEALRLLEGVAERDGYNAAALVELGEVNQVSGALAVAQRCFGFALLLEPRNYAAVVGMVGVLCRRRAARSHRETRRLAQHFLTFALDTWPHDRQVQHLVRPFDALATARVQESGPRDGSGSEEAEEEVEIFKATQ
jgi:hypothetical protein